METRQITFKSGGLKCAGDLYLPDNYSPSKRFAGVVIGHGFAVLKKSLVDEGHILARAGYVTLAIDYRRFGESEGEPRGHLVPLDQVEDFRNAISFLQEVEGVDPKRIGIWGCSFAGAVVMYTAAVDRRVKAVVCQQPITDGWLRNRVLRSGEEFEEMLDALDRDRARRYKGEPSAPLPIFTGELAGLPVSAKGLKAFDDFSKRKGSPMLHFSPDPLRVESLERILEFSPLNVVDRISPRALLIVAGLFDLGHPMHLINEAYKRAGEPKKMVVAPLSGIDPYGEPGTSMALSHAVKWFDEYLA